MKILLIILAAAVQLNENWDNNEVNGWTSTNYVGVIDSTNYCLDISFLSQAVPVEENILVYKEITNIYPTAISLTVKCNNTIYPSGLFLCMRSSNVWWKTSLPLFITDQYISYNINTMYAKWNNDTTTNSYPSFFLDLRHITAIGVYLARSADLSEQHYNIDNFIPMFLLLQNKLKLLVDINTYF